MEYGKASWDRISGGPDEWGMRHRLDGGSDGVGADASICAGFLGVVGCGEATASAPGMTSA